MPRQRGTGQFPNNSFFHFQTAGEDEAGVLLWVGSEGVWWGLEKNKSFFHQLNPAQREGIPREATGASSLASAPKPSWGHPRAYAPAQGKPM